MLDYVIDLEDDKYELKGQLKLLNTEEWNANIIKNKNQISQLYIISQQQTVSI